MKYVMTFSARRGPRVLEDGATRQTVAEECRKAALDFMDGVSRGWDKLELALWLTGPYARATGHTPRGERVHSMVDAVDVDTVELESIESQARSRIVTDLRRGISAGGRLDLAEESIARGLVSRALDADGESAWVPVDLARMRLRDRVASLFAADYLNEPAAYDELFVCPRCDGVVFDSGAQKIGFCGTHKRHSGIVPKDLGGEVMLPAPRASGDDEV